MKRPNGQGSVFYDKKRERYVGSFVTPEGKRVTKRFRTEKQAEEWLEDNRFRIRHNTFVTPLNLKTGVWIVQYLTLYKINVRPQTLENYATYARHMSPIASIPLQKLTAADIQGAIRRWQEEKLSDNYISNILALLNSSLKKAAALDLITKNPMAAVERPKQTKKQVQVFTVEEVQKLLKAKNHCNRRMHMLIAVAAYTGMRIGEILALEWRDIFPTYIQVDKTVIARTGQVQKGTKTSTSTRKVTIPDELYDELMSFQQYSHASRGLVFHSRTGKVLNPSTLRITFEHIQEREGITPPRSFHALRHTLASQLIANGVSAAEVAKRLGHSNPAVTLSIYTQWIPGGDAKVADDVQRIFSTSTN